MKQNKTAILITISILLLSVFLYFVPIGNLVEKLPFVNRFYNNTSLEILTPNGKAKVWVDGVEYGETPTTVDDLAEGEYTVELEKVVAEDSFYEKKTFIVTLTRNTTARMELEIGPEGILHGAIMYYTPLKTSSQEGMLTILAENKTSKVFLDGEYLKDAPITNLQLKDNQYEVKIVSQGYEDLEIPIVIRNDYSLILKTYQMPIPVIFETATNE